MLIDDQSLTVKGLLKPEAYGLKSSQKILVKETNISQMFLTGDKAYKLKRGVKYPYADFSTLEKRKEACFKEAELCKRNTPDFCHGVEEVVQDKKGRIFLRSVCSDETAEVIDFVIVMEEFHESMLFERMIEQGDLDRFEMMDTAEHIFNQQEKSEKISDRDAVEIIRKRIIENNAMIRCFVPALFDEEDVAEMEEAQLKALKENEELLRTRAENGKIRACHGDLTLRNLALWNGKVISLNPVEFNEEISEIDTLYDFAFLLVELESKGVRRLSSILFNHYMALTADWGGISVLPLFLSCRAAVNAYVFAQRSSEMKDKQDAVLMANKAYEYFVIAKRFLVPSSPVLLACGGLSGSGKSRIGRESAPFLGNPPGAVILRDDVLRKNLLKASLDSLIETSNYTSEVEAEVFKLLCEECKHVLKSGQSVVADALFHNEVQRIAIENVAKEMNVPFQGVWVDAPLDVRAERVFSRKRNPSDVKTLEELKRQLDVDVGEVTWDKIDTSGDRMATLTQVRALLEKKV